MCPFVLLPVFEPDNVGSIHGEADTGGAVRESIDQARHVQHRWHVSWLADVKELREMRDCKSRPCSLANMEAL